MVTVPAALQRLAAEVDGWLDLRCPDKALERMTPLLDDQQGRPAGLAFRVRAYVELARFHDAVADLQELRQVMHDPEWLDLTEAWCLKRIGDLPAAIACMERLLLRNQKSAIGHFNLACYLALSGNQDRAVDEVTIACGLEAQFRELAQEERDLAALADDPRFKALLQTPSGD